MRLPNGSTKFVLDEYVNATAVLQTKNQERVILTPDMLITRKATVELYFQRYLSKGYFKKFGWSTPLGILVTVIGMLTTTTSFKNEFWKDVFIVFAFVITLWFVAAVIYSICTRVRAKDFIKNIVEDIPQPSRISR